MMFQMRYVILHQVLERHRFGLRHRFEGDFLERVQRARSAHFVFVRAGH